MYFHSIEKQKNLHLNYLFVNLKCDICFELHSSYNIILTLLIEYLFFFSNKFVTKTMNRNTQLSLEKYQISRTVIFLNLRKSLFKKMCVK